MELCFLNPHFMPAVNMAPGHGMPGNLSSNQANEFDEL